MEVECVVIGAGVVGLACARRLAMAGVEVVVLESQQGFGTETSSRNSEVIHAGIYYPKDSLKARLCILGKEQLYDYCVKHRVAHRKIGKLIVATHEQEIDQLKAIQNKAFENGVSDLMMLSRSETAALEPSIVAHAALYSPSTGIIDSHGLMLALLGDLENAGGMIGYRSTVISGSVQNDGFGLKVKTAEGPDQTLFTRKLVNAAGLHASNVAFTIQGIPAESILKTYYCKGTYFMLNASSPFNHLIYPVHNAAGLGVHVTLDLSLQARFGPDTEWIDCPNYDIDDTRVNQFYNAIRRYWPQLKDNSLQSGYCGIRPKIVGPSEPSADFNIQCKNSHGLPGLVQLFGIESPGLTACLAIADQVAAKLGIN
jgi:L-2-hydroxyglutarate oxidase LhgO